MKRMYLAGILSCLVLGMFVVLSGSLSQGTLQGMGIAQAQTSERCFPETGYCIAGNIRRYWEQNGGLPVFGYPIGSERIETIEEHWTGPVQWFERDRLEDHGSQGVMAGRLGDDILQLHGMAWRDFPKVNGAGSGCRFFAQTEHSLCEPFLGYWQSHGGLERFGYPITEPFVATISDWTGTIQYFERRRMEHHTEFQGTAHEVLLGLLGNEVKEFSGEQQQPSPPPSQYPYPAPSEEDEAEQDVLPTDTPTMLPTDAPTMLPTDTPTMLPTDAPTMLPTDAPTMLPTDAPTMLPTDTPTMLPTDTPTMLPTDTPTPTPDLVANLTPGECVSPEEAKLIQLINDYRQTHGLSPVPISKSMMTVAQWHVRDLENHQPDHGTDSRGMDCNMHSWSSNGPWTPVCYTSDHKYASGMWDKPREITGGKYSGNGYENSHGGSSGWVATAESALRGWKNSSAHNAVMIEEGIWEDANWQAMGVGIYGSYAVLWFGKETDPQGTLSVCTTN